MGRMEQLAALSSGWVAVVFCRANPPVQSAVNRGRAAYDGTHPKRPDQCFGVDLWGIGIEWIARLFRLCVRRARAGRTVRGVLGGGVTGAAQTCYAFLLGHLDWSSCRRRFE